MLLQKPGNLFVSACPPQGKTKSFAGFAASSAHTFPYVTIYVYLHGITRTRDRWTLARADGKRGDGRRQMDESRQSVTASQTDNQQPTTEKTERHTDNDQTIHALTHHPTNQ